MVEQPLGVFAPIPGGGHKLFQNQLLVGPQCLVIRWRNLLEQDPSGLRPQSVYHVFLLSSKQPEIERRQIPFRCLTILILLSGV